MGLLETAQQKNSDLMTVERELRTKVGEVVRAYRHSWDVYSELLQNAVDAINRRYRMLNDPQYFRYEAYRLQYPEAEPDAHYKGRIAISIDVLKKQIQICDNGVGIASENLERFLLPEGTDKRMGQEYGFKGYGLTYVAFISRTFSLTSRPLAPSERSEHQICLSGLFSWLIDDTGNTPFPNGPVPDAQPAPGKLADTWNTIVSVELEDEYAVRFPAVSSAQQAIELVESQDRLHAFEYVLRTRTAVGNTRPLFRRPPIVPIDITLSIRFADGSEQNDIPIPYRYFHPREHDEVAVDDYEFSAYVKKTENRGI